MFMIRLVRADAVLHCVNNMDDINCCVVGAVLVENCIIFGWAGGGVGAAGELGNKSYSCCNCSPPVFWYCVQHRDDLIVCMHNSTRSKYKKQQTKQRQRIGPNKEITCSEAFSLNCG